MLIRPNLPAIQRRRPSHLEKGISPTHQGKARRRFLGAGKSHSPQNTPGRNRSLSPKYPCILASHTAAALPCSLQKRRLVLNRRSFLGKSAAFSAAATLERAYPLQAMMHPQTFPKDFLWGAATAAMQIEGTPMSKCGGESVWDPFLRQHDRRRQLQPLAGRHRHHPSARHQRLSLLHLLATRAARWRWPHQPLGARSL